mmetsp:Transcript_10661/g.16224  ORF Transcript_10661/g.16224 Transcript_10661/m.16224 type:complete len:496 (-) Transcript_10661:237-1724(-)
MPITNTNIKTRQDPPPGDTSRSAHTASVNVKNNKESNELKFKLNKVDKTLNLAGMCLNIINLRIGLFMVLFFLLINSFVLHRSALITYKILIDNSIMSMSRIEDMTGMLETSSIQYYVYNNESLSLPHIRAKATEDAPMTWKGKWGRRFAHYGLGEIRWLESLEGHPLRTMDPSEAVFFVVPIPVTAAMFWGSTNKKELGNAFEAILNGALFQKYPERHVVAISTSEKAFGWSFWGLSNKEMKQFDGAMVVRDSDRDRVDKWKHENNLTYCIENDKAGKIFTKVVALGFGGDGSNSHYAYQAATLENWNKKKFWFFYHTRESASSCSSTAIRHAFFSNSTKPTLLEHQPVSIGMGLPYEEWKQTYENSKFCLVLRGDNPGSRALLRSVRNGCIPLIVSDPLPFYQPLYERTLQYDDFALIIREDDFLMDPIGSLDTAVSSLSPANIMHKLEGLRLLQRIIAVDQPGSLFVQAFSREIVEAMKENGVATEKVGAIL